MERGRIQGVPKFLGTPYYLRNGKATDFKFCRNIHTVHRNKSPCWEMLGIVAVGVVRESRKFSGHPCAFRGHLCDSTAFLFCTCTYALSYRMIEASCGVYLDRWCCLWWRNTSELTGPTS